MNTTPYPDTLLLISNQWVESYDSQSIEVRSPATGLPIGKVALAATPDIDRAIAAAQQGFHTWRVLPAIERATIIRRAATLLRERSADIARVLTMEQGKPLAEAKIEVVASAEILEWFADEACRIYGRIVPPRHASVDQMVLKEPVGPVAAFTPWNFPINQIVRKLGAALASGCSFLLKAPEETPASPAALFQAFMDAGCPPGVLGLLFGNPAEISQHVIAHSVIRKLTFTGSTAVGKQLAALAGNHMKRVTMELGGHAPVIIAEDADVALAVKAAGSFKFRNAGQVCISPTRFIVHESLMEEFTQGIVALAERLRIGNGLDDGINLGPLANDRRLTAMTALVEDACAKGAKVATGGARIGSQGHFYKPTVLVDVPQNARVLNEEPFGPIAAIRGYRDLDDAICEANRLSLGLAAYAFTRSLKNAHQIAHRVEAGMVWINQQALPTPEMPFGGVKDSGYGTEGGPEAVEAYLNTKAVSISVA